MERNLKQAKRLFPFSHPDLAEESRTRGIELDGHGDERKMGSRQDETDQRDHDVHGPFEKSWLPLIEISRTPIIGMPPRSSTSRWLRVI